jgi:hypothetical protein
MHTKVGGEGNPQQPGHDNSRQKQQAKRHVLFFVKKFGNVVINVEIIVSCDEEKVTKFNGHGFRKSKRSFLENEDPEKIESDPKDDIIPCSFLSHWKRIALQNYRTFSDTYAFLHHSRKNLDYHKIDFFNQEDVLVNVNNFCTAKDCSFFVFSINKNEKQQSHFF